MKEMEMLKYIENNVDNETRCCTDEKIDEDLTVEENLEIAKNLFTTELYLLGGDMFNCEDRDDDEVAKIHDDFQEKMGYTGFHDWDILWSTIIKEKTVKGLFDIFTDFHNKLKEVFG